MGMKYRLFNIFFFIAITLSYSAPAADMPPFDLKAIYEFQFAGVPVGRMGFEAEQAPEHYDIAADITSVGIARLFAKHSSHTVVAGTGSGGAYSDILYRTDYKTKEKRKSVKMTQKDSEFTEEDVQPPDNRAKRPAVPAEIKKGAYDPLSLNMALRQKTWEALQSQNKSFSVNVYDGRRLTEVDATVADKKIIRLDGKKVASVRVAVRRKPLAGYTVSELDDIDPKEPTLWVYYSDDGRLIPLYLEMGFLFGKLTATLAKECRTGESCLLGIKE